MARTVDELKSIYDKMPSTSKKGFGMRGRGGHGGPGGPGGRAGGGKPASVSRSVKRLFSYTGKYKFLFLPVFLCMLLSTAASLAGSYMLAPVIDRLIIALNPHADINISTFEAAADRVIAAVSGKPGIESIISSKGTSAGAGDVTVYILTALIILAAVYVVSFVSTYLQSRIMLSISQNAVESIRTDLFEKLQKLPVRYFDSNTVGDIMSRFTNDIDNIDVMLNNSLTSLVSGAFTLIGTFVFMITTSPVLTAVTVVFVPIFMKCGGIISKRSRKYFTGQQSALGAVNGYMEETVTGAKVVKVFNHEDVCVEEFSSLNDDLRNKQMMAQFFGGIMGPILGNLSQVCYAVTVGIGGILMCFGKLTAGGLTVFAGYSRQFSQPINSISMQVSTVFSALAGAERVFAVIDGEPEKELLAPDAKKDKLTGDVEFKNVTFGYTPDKTVLKNLSLHASPGQKVAFVGSTGAGKTTVTNLINRFYDIREGEITIDGADIGSLPLPFLRKNIAMVLQDTHLFTGTVRENIRYGRTDATDEEVESAAKTAGAHSFIMRLENGYDTMLEGDGSNLSQGQRQLLNIARAALSKAPILVLDEATSSVDTRTERHIEHGMDRLMKNRTTFVIAHRLSTVRNADMILVLEHGEIVERGSHDELLAAKGRYYDLCTGAVELD